ncbi:MAG: hypothetical protein V7655_11145 [Aequorivita antarctica]
MKAEIISLYLFAQLHNIPIAGPEQFRNKLYTIYRLINLRATPSRYKKPFNYEGFF